MIVLSLGWRQIPNIPRSTNAILSKVALLKSRIFQGIRFSAIRYIGTLQLKTYHAEEKNDPKLLKEITLRIECWSAFSSLSCSIESAWFTPVCKLLSRPRRPRLCTCTWCNASRRLGTPSLVRRFWNVDESMVGLQCGRREIWRWIPEH